MLFRSQQRWEEQGTNRLTAQELRSAERPFYNLMMFPYPSAEGLHVGNIYAFTGADIFGRFKRLQGYRVFEPVGLDRKSVGRTSSRSRSYGARRTPTTTS